MASNDSTMKSGRAQEQFVVLKIRNGQPVSQAELQRAVAGGFVTIDREGRVSVTPAGQRFLGHA
jgi:hypothetical protein